MDSFDGLRESDPAVTARYLGLRGYFHDHVLPRVETLLTERYAVQPVKRLSATLSVVLRGGFDRPGEGELWPAVFLTAVDIFPAICLQITAERLTGLGTALNGPRRIRHRHWEDWWGWESRLADLRPRFFELAASEQLDTLVGWYADHLEWLAHNGLLVRR